MRQKSFLFEQELVGVSSSSSHCRMMNQIYNSFRRAPINIFSCNQAKQIKPLSSLLRHSCHCQVFSHSQGHSLRLHPPWITARWQCRTGGKNTHSPLSLSPPSFSILFPLILHNSAVVCSTATRLGSLGVCSLYCHDLWNLTPFPSLCLCRVSALKKSPYDDFVPWRNSNDVSFCTDFLCCCYCFCVCVCVCFKQYSTSPAWTNSFSYCDSPCISAEKQHITQLLVWMKKLLFLFPERK